MTCLDTHLRDRALSSPATLDIDAPDVILYEKNKDKYLAELKRLSNSWFLASNGYEVFPVNPLLALYYFFIGLFGKSNPCDTKIVRHTVKKLLYFGYIQQYLPQDDTLYLSTRYANYEEQARYRERKSPYRTESLQTALVESYQHLHPEKPEQENRLFGQALVQSNLWDRLLILEPQDNAILNALTCHFSEAPIDLSEESGIRDTLAQRFLARGLWQIAIKIDAHCLKGQEAETFKACINQKQYQDAASLFEAYNGRVDFDIELRKQLAEALYDEKQSKVRERDHHHAEARALMRQENADLPVLKKHLQEARKAAEEVIIFAQRSDILFNNEHNQRDKGFAKSLAVAHLRAAEIFLSHIPYLPLEAKERHIEAIWSQLKMAQIEGEPLLEGYLEATEKLYELLLLHYHTKIIDAPTYAQKKQWALDLNRYLEELLCIDDKFHQHLQKNTSFFAKIYWISGELHSYFQLDTPRAYLHLAMAYKLVPNHLLYMFSIGREHDVVHSVFRQLLQKNIAKEARKQHRSLEELEQFTHHFWSRHRAYEALESWNKPAITTLERIQDLMFESQDYVGKSLHSSFSIFHSSAGKLKSLVHSFLERTAAKGKYDAENEDVHQSRAHMLGF